MKKETDLEKLNKDRRRAEEEYLASQQAMLEIRRIQRDGINNVEDLVLYVNDVIGSVIHAEDLARASNNNIIYSEAVGIRREMGKLLDLIFKDGMAMESIDGTEEKHRETNKGEEGYA